MHSFLKYFIIKKPQSSYFDQSNCFMKFFWFSAKQINASLITLLSMPSLDVAMPIALFIVVVVALLLN